MISSSIDQDPIQSKANIEDSSESVFRPIRISLDPLGISVLSASDAEKLNLPNEPDFYLRLAIKYGLNKDLQGEPSSDLPKIVLNKVDAEKAWGKSPSDDFVAVHLQSELDWPVSAVCLLAEADLCAVMIRLDKSQDEYAALQKEADARDHRIIGKNQGLFSQNELAPGSWFFSKEGAIVYNGLIEMMRQQYRFRGYDEVISPNLYNLKIFKISGHYQNYSKHMFMLRDGDSGMVLKPMNCPGHYLIYKSKLRSYKDLPLRLAEFGVLHRNELSGALSGLSRCRRFQVDDCHIFCAESQIRDEIMDNLNFVKEVYALFGFEYKFFLSSKPEKYLGDDEVWEKAEGQLKQALDDFGLPWKENPGDGAFYGPKIDIVLYDAFGRAHQCATIQLDFQAAIRFNMMYKADDSEDSPIEALSKEFDGKKGKYFDFEPDEYDSQPFRWEERPLKPGFKRPVIVHRAVLGSIERFISILIEHNLGKWPFWLSPRQVIVIPVSHSFYEYAERVNQALKFNGFHSSVDLSNLRLNKKIRNAQLEQWNYMLIVGKEEAESGMVNVRLRDGSIVGMLNVDDLIDKLEQERQLFPKFRFSDQS
eukprot:CAMPEP_0168346240 /NCGR_PEP_ID=MMETSP0213-20121227/18130_1 /TAXON_ID=151035 /ORGANISM="Euplotes harpa, Strain FSP1.4" /LENGTH=590 /DNA_ID=CAMNT_0008354807 /DNA_START=174 /DNA_END=1947 /DNA_ORIENTATION=-